jgi:hypothetical protein
VTTYHGIKSAVRLCCLEGGIITDTYTLEFMNDAPGGIDCPKCGGTKILWTQADGSMAITEDNEDGDSVHHSVTQDVMRDLYEQTPTLTLGQLRTLTYNLPNDLPLTIYTPEGQWMNLSLSWEIVKAQIERFKADAEGRPHDAEPSLVIDAIDNFDTRQW